MKDAGQLHHDPKASEEPRPGEELPEGSWETALERGPEDKGSPE